MAYQARRIKQHTEEFELVNDDGSIYKKFVVPINVEGFGRRLSQKYVSFQRIVQEGMTFKRSTENSESLPENTDQIYQLVGEATVDLMYAVFGDDAKEIIDFYDRNYIEMLQQIMPFVEHVLQQVRSLGKIERKNAIKSYTNR